MRCHSLHVQGRVTDHRIGMSQHNIDDLMMGSGLQTFIDALQQHSKTELLSSI